MVTFILRLRLVTFTFALRLPRYVVYIYDVGLVVVPHTVDLFPFDCWLDLFILVVGCYYGLHFVRLIITRSLLHGYTVYVYVDC